MAKVTVQIAGGREVEHEASTIAELKGILGVSGHQAQINGEPASDDAVLEPFDFVTLTQQVKGAAIPTLPTGMHLPIIWLCRF